MVRSIRIAWAKTQRQCIGKSSQCTAGRKGVREGGGNGGKEGGRTGGRESISPPLPSLPPYPPQAKETAEQGRTGKPTLNHLHCLGPWKP